MDTALVPQSLPQINHIAYPGSWESHEVFNLSSSFSRFPNKLELAGNMFTITYYHPHYGSNETLVLSGRLRTPTPANSGTEETKVIGHITDFQYQLRRKYWRYGTGARSPFLHPYLLYPMIENRTFGCAAWISSVITVMANMLAPATITARMLDDRLDLRILPVPTEEQRQRIVETISIVCEYQWRDPKSFQGVYEQAYRLLMNDASVLNDISAMLGTVVDMIRKRHMFTGREYNMLVADAQEYLELLSCLGILTELSSAISGIVNLYQSLIRE